MQVVEVVYVCDNIAVYALYSAGKGKLVLLLSDEQELCRKAIEHIAHFCRVVPASAREVDSALFKSSNIVRLVCDSCFNLRQTPINTRRSQAQLHIVRRGQRVRELRNAANKEAWTALCYISVRVQQDIAE